MAPLATRSSVGCLPDTPSQAQLVRRGAAHESGGVCGVGESVRSSKETLGDTAPEEALGPVLSGLNWKLGFPLGDMGTGDPAIINHFLDSDTLSRGFHHAVSSSFFDFSCALV